MCIDIFGSCRNNYLRYLLHDGTTCRGKFGILQRDFPLRPHQQRTCQCTLLLISTTPQQHKNHSGWHWSSLSWQFESWMTTELVRVNRLITDQFIFAYVPVEQVVLLYTLILQFHWSSDTMKSSVFNLWSKLSAWQALSRICQWHDQIIPNHINWEFVHPYIKAYASYVPCLELLRS